MEDKTTEITLVTVCDNHYALMLAALLKSIEINFRGSTKINLYIVDDGLREQIKKKVVHSMDNQVFNLTWLKLKDIIPGGTRLPLDSSTFPLNVYARLFIPHFIPSSAERVLYLDVDMIVETDISQLWKIDMEGKVVAGVVDRSGVVSNTWGGITNYQELGLRPDTKYFNSGLMVIDALKWRNQDLTNQVLRCIKENSRHAGFPDQYGLNVVLADQWLELDSKWNCYAISSDPNPFIIHFIGVKPIYTSYEFNPHYRERFFHYLSFTEWSKFEPVSNNIRLLKKLYTKIVKAWRRLIS